jgi:hypothetical protein
MKKLISITEHSDYLETLNISNSERWVLHCLRKEFGKRSLKLGMFVPCDLDGNVLEFKGTIRFSIEDWGSRECFEQYQEAKERVLFEGVSHYKQYRCSHIIQQDGYGHLLGFYSTGKIHSSYKIIEDLIPRNLTLTENALKQIGIKI